MADARDRSGEVLAGRYRLLSQIGSGGMGTVYAAEHTEVGRKVAIKILRAEASGRPSLVERFRREARAAGTIDHENIVECVDNGVTDDGLLFYVMEYLKGEDLLSVLKRERVLPWPRARSIIAQLCRALAAAHASGIAHRDLKPSNLFLIRRGDNPEFLKLLDFGIAKLLGEENDGEGLTKYGEVVGTTPYMAPEMAAGEQVDHRIDVYATGVVLVQLLTGHLPFHGKNPRQVLAAILKGDPPRIHDLNPLIAASPALDAVVSRALHRDRDKRFPDMAALHDALLELPDDACTRLYIGSSAAVPAEPADPETQSQQTAEFSSRPFGPEFSSQRTPDRPEPALPALPLPATPIVHAATPAKPTPATPSKKAPAVTQPASGRSSAPMFVLILVIIAAGLAAYVAIFGVPDFMRSPPPVT
jgi:serine/threonine protein kinase